MNDIAAMGGVLAMVDVMSIRIFACARYQAWRPPSSSMADSGRPLIDCGYQAIDISIIGSVPKTDIIRNDTAERATI